ncbi:MAG: hypothetical protein ACOH2M_16355 [Cypionkella sp.]
MLRRNCAAQRGVSEAAVRKAIATGRITTLPNGTIDPAQADSEWGAQTDPAKQRGQHARQMGAETAAGTAQAAATKPVPQAAIRAVADTLRDAGTDPGSPEATGGEVSFLRARMANEVLKAQTAKVRLEKMKAEVIDPSRATAIEQGHDTAHGGAWAIQLRVKTTNDAGLRSLTCKVFTSSILWTSSGA